MVISHTKVNMAAEDTNFDVHLRVQDAKKKSKFRHFERTDISRFSYPEEFKQHLLNNHNNAVRPAESTNFKIGYFIKSHRRIG